jgi:hypothetical protein
MLENQKKVLRLLSPVIQALGRRPARTATTTPRPPRGWKALRVRPLSPALRASLKRLEAYGAPHIPNGPEDKGRPSLRSRRTGEQG